MTLLSASLYITNIIVSLFIYNDDIIVSLFVYNDNIIVSLLTGAAWPRCPAAGSPPVWWASTQC